MGLVGRFYVNINIFVNYFFKTLRMYTIKRICFLVLFAVSLPVGSQNKVSKRIMEIGRTDNRTMQHLDVLVNRIGGRPIGSDAYENATYWVANKLKEWEFRKWERCPWALIGVPGLERCMAMPPCRLIL